MKRDQEVRGESPSRLHTALAVLGWSYFCLLWFCIALAFAFQDEWWWLGFLNTFTLYWFAPLLVIWPLFLLLRKRGMQLAGLFSVCVFLLLFGQLLVPKWVRENPGRPRITVMTYNLYVGNHDWNSIRETISESGADVIALQELTLEMAKMVSTDLAESYPYQILGFGDSLISRYPITLTDVARPDSWGTMATVYQVNLNGRSVTLVNAHFYASVMSFDHSFTESVFRAREHQAQLVADFSAEVETPLILAADLNAADTNLAYHIITSQLHDSWREAGWGLGHTFPGGPIPYVPRPLVAGHPVPRWLVRIDYVLHSDDWRAVEARLGRWDGVSDHRPVIAVLELQEGALDGRREKE